MSKLLNDIVQFRGDKLFNGAVSIDWLECDEAKALAASSSFVFHGPAYHGVSQDDIGTSHGHRLQDTASFAKTVFRRCYRVEDQPFTLAIAGYGTGKSHLGLTLGMLLSKPTGVEADIILSGIESVDREIATDIKTIIFEANQPCLVIALNGMQSFDLASEVSRQIMVQIKRYGGDTRPLDDLRPRFSQASSLIQMAAGNKDVVNDLLSTCDVESIDIILKKLNEQDDTIYKNVHRVLESRNITITAFGGESVRDIVDVVSREYCGAGKIFRSISIIFDEFGRYTEFATIKSHIAGSGSLQDLFEAVQNNAEKACFIGFIQYDLNNYVQRVAREHRSEILRYITRYQSANKIYLSTNLETLIASIIEKKDTNYISKTFDNDYAIQQSKIIQKNILKWFPTSQNHRLWVDLNHFHSMICKGCWPLSPYTVWLLFYFASVGKHLQERSVLALLGDAFNRTSSRAVENGNTRLLTTEDFWSESLQQELITSEEGGQQGTITHSYSSVIARHGVQLSTDHVKLLRSVVLASKLGMKSSSQEETSVALSELSGVPFRAVQDALKLLREEFNILEWDESGKQFDILGDAVPRTQFLAFIRNRVANTFDNTGRASLFLKNAGDICDILSDLDCDFAEENKVTTKEWRYQAIISNLDVLQIHVKQASDRCVKAITVDEPRGTVIYCYVEPSWNIADVESDASKLLKAVAKDVKFAALPILIVLIYDDEGKLGQSLAELSILEDSLSTQDAAKFGNLVLAHKQKMRDNINSYVAEMVKQRRYITAFKDPIEATRLGRVGTSIFANIYKSQIPFPFDGFTTTKGNAATTCQILSAELLQGRLDWSAVIAKPAKDQNRATSVLRESWGVFAKNGTIRTRPEHPTLKLITEKWDNQLATGEKKLLLQDALKMLCAPPYGANIASAGLFIGVFVSARLEKLSIVKDGQPISVNEWVHSGVFKGSYLDHNALHNVEIILSGESSSEWESLLDEWEQAETYRARLDCKIKAGELKKRLPVPAVQAYRELYLDDIGSKAAIELEKNEKYQDEAINKIHTGLERQDAALLAWGAAELFNLINQMTSNKVRWTDHEIEQIKPIAERSRQELIQIFPDWLNRQAPKDGSPESAGDFKHKMINKVGGNLDKLSLDGLKDDLVKYTKISLRRAELIASAHRMIEVINLWLTTSSQAANFIRIANLRTLLKEGADFSSKLRNISTYIDIKNLQELRFQLASRIDEIKKAIDKTNKRTSKLWNEHIFTLEDAERLQNEVDELISVFEGCTDDINDFQIMRQALRSYIQAYKQLNNDQLTWDEFDSLTDKLKSEVSDALGEDGPPWDPIETIDRFVKIISKNRQDISSRWIQDLENHTANMDSLSTADLNLLYSRSSLHPSFLLKSHLVRIKKVNTNIENHLNKRKVDWLIEQYKVLTPKMQKEFLSQISM